MIAILSVPTVHSARRKICEYLVKQFWNTLLLDSIPEKKFSWVNFKKALSIEFVNLFKKMICSTYKRCVKCLTATKVSEKYTKFIRFTYLVKRIRFSVFTKTQLIQISQFSDLFLFTKEIFFKKTNFFWWITLKFLEKPKGNTLLEIIIFTVARASHATLVPTGSMQF